MDISKKQYDNMIQQSITKTKSYKTIPAAFIVGGFICMTAQWFSELLITMGIEKVQALNYSSFALIILASLLTGLNVFDNIAKFAGAGTLVPITGFSNAVTAPALEFKSEGFILGVGAKMFIIAGPVIVYGTVSSILYGIIYYFVK